MKKILGIAVCISFFVMPSYVSAWEVELARAEAVRVLILRELDREPVVQLPKTPAPPVKKVDTRDLRRRAVAGQITPEEARQLRRLLK